MPSLRGEAEFLRVAIAMGLLDTNAAVDWADRAIMALDAPPIEVIDVSLGSKQPTDEMVRLLASVPGPGDLTAAAHRALSLLRERMEAGTVTVEGAVGMLVAYRYCGWASIPDDEALKVDLLSWMLQDVQDDVYGTLDSVREELIAFLDRWAPRPAAIDEILYDGH